MNRNRKPAPIGEKFNKWTILAEAPDRKWGTQTVRYVLCQCDCGAKREIILRSVLHGRSKSCKCDNTTTFKHGHSRRSPTYTSWTKMKERCYSPAHSDSFGWYGAEGVEVCERWRNADTGFQNFLSDMGERPEGATLDRRRNSEGYTPDNCKWSTRKEQTRNRRSNRFIEFQGERLVLQDWAARTGIKRETIARRLNKGWPVEVALTKQPKQSN